jgi:hypothetical protein
MARREIKLRHPATCARCGASLPRGTRAIWDDIGKTATCTGCHRAERRAPGHAGASAQRRIDRDRDAREQRVRARFPRLGGLILAATDEPTSTKNWAKGAEGERRLGERLDALAEHGILTLHDRVKPGSSRANIDHLAVTATGVWVIDAKHWTGRVERRDVGGWFRTDHRLFVGGRDRSKAISGVQGQVAAVTTCLDGVFPDVPVHGALCFIDADLSIFSRPFTLGDVLVTWRKALAKRLREDGPLTTEMRTAVAADLDRRLPPVPR